MPRFGLRKLISTVFLQNFGGHFVIEAGALARGCRFNAPAEFFA